MFRGSCLCGGVRFEIERAVGPFELCHCTRCRKVSGSAYLTWLGVRREDFRLLQGADLIKTYEPLIRPDKHIYVEFKAPWDRIADELPRMTKKDIRASRNPSLTKRHP